MNTRPLIGITSSEIRLPQRVETLPESEPHRKELALGLKYPSAIAQAGGVPVILPPTPDETVPALVRHLSGLCLSGGPDIDPQSYGESPHPCLGVTEPEIDRFEMQLLRFAEEYELPVLGICRGAQMLNVYRGGTLFQDLPDQYSSDVIHRQKESLGGSPTHHVRFEGESRLQSIYGCDSLQVNSFHHQAARQVGKELDVVARSPDGVVEALEDPRLQFFMGVQWHAEWMTDRPEHQVLFAAFVETATQYMRDR